MIKKSLKEMAQKSMNDCEAIINQAFEASGLSVIDLLDNDEEVFATIGMGIKAYKSMRDLLMVEAEMMDEMNEKLSELDELKEDVNELRKQNDEMRRLLIKQDGMMKQILANVTTNEK